MAKNRVIAGTYQGRHVMEVWGKLYIFTGLFKEDVTINKSTVCRYEVMSETQTKSAASVAGRGLVGGLLLGPVGLLAGALSARAKGDYVVAIEFHNGDKSLLEIDEKLYKTLLRHLF